MTITAAQMQNAFFRGNYDRFDIITPNTYLNYMEGELDILGVRKSGYVDEIEIKRSKSDFKADFKKTVTFVLPKKDGEWWSGHEDVNKHEALQAARLAPNRFSFYIPKEMEGTVEIPNYAGLYIYDGRFAREVKAPKLLHKRKLEPIQRIHLGQKMAYRYWHLVLKEELRKEKL